MEQKKFAEIELMETFIYENKMFFKVRSTEHMNACCLSDGEMYKFEGCEMVMTIDIAMVVVDKGTIDKMIEYGIPTINPNNIQEDIEKWIEHASNYIDRYREEHEEDEEDYDEDYDEEDDEIFS